MARAKSPAASASPPGAGRRVVVLRPGPPPAKRAWGSITAGVLGFMLLVAAGALAFALPKEDILPPQFKVTFTQDQVDLPGQTKQFNFTEGRQEQEFLYNITHNDVTEISFNVEFVDDLAASDPDRFQIEFLDPEGNHQGPAEILMNLYPQQNASTPGKYDPVRATAIYKFGIIPPPEDTVIETDLNGTEESVAFEQEQLNHITTIGTWKVRVRLSIAGGCPTPSESAGSPDTALRATACLNENSGQGASAQKDMGNPFTVGSFSYRYFTVSAERL